jgi:large subunit ribosomal protein L29
MKFKELDALDDKSLNTKLRDLKLELMKENSQVATGTSAKSSGKLRSIKKTIARIKTIMTSRERIR